MIIENSLCFFLSSVLLMLLEPGIMKIVNPTNSTATIRLKSKLNKAMIAMRRFCCANSERVRLYCSGKTGFLSRNILKLVGYHQ